MRAVLTGLLLFGESASLAQVAPRPHLAVGVFRVQAGPLARAAMDWDRARTTWTNPDGTGHVDGAPLLTTLSSAGAAKPFADARPRSNKGDFFGRLYHGYGAR